MNKKKVYIIDYKCGNLKSVINAFKKINCEVLCTNDISILNKADALVLPGVGAFPNCMNNFLNLKLDTFLKKYLKEQRKCLGICVGMQMLNSFSTEFKMTNGLSIIPGKILNFNDISFSNSDSPLPNVGWYSLNIKKDISNFAKSFLDGLNNKDLFYFIHSYARLPSQKYEVATSKYNDKIFSSIISKDQLIGVQFHPEKSGEIGLELLKNFVKI